MRRLLLFAIVSLLLGSSVLAQMAAPSLIPAAPGVSDAAFLLDPKFLPYNPAVMPWRGYSTGGGGVARAEGYQGAVHTDTEDEPSQVVRIEISYGGVQWTESPYAVGFQTMTLTSDTNGADPHAVEATTLAGAWKLRDLVSFGASYYTAKDTRVEVEELVSGPRIGVSFRFLDTWYVGAVAGRETMNRNFVHPFSEDWSGPRTVVGYGVGYLNEGPWRLHAEVSAVDFGKVRNPEGEDIIQRENRTVVLEAAHDWWVAGLSIVQFKETRGSDDFPLVFTSNGNELTLGTLPQKGFSLLFHYGFSEITVDVGEFADPVKLSTASRALSLIWLF